MSRCSARVSSSSTIRTPPAALALRHSTTKGVANRRFEIVKGGVLTTWLLNASAARQLGLATTGHAARGLAGPPSVGVSNLALSTGEKDLAGLMREAGAGVLVTSMFGPSLTPTMVTGQ